MKYLLIPIIISLSLASCVSSKKFSDLEVLKDHYRMKGDTLAITQKQNSWLNKSLNETKSELAQTKSELTATSGKLEQLQSSFTKLSADYGQLENNISVLSTSSQNETKQLRGQLDQATLENGKMKDILSKIYGDQKRYDSSGSVIEDSWNSKLQNMLETSQKIDAEKSQARSLFSMLASLPLFQEEGLEVLMKGDAVLVRMGADNIFRKGNNQVNNNGQKVLEEITGVILRNSNLDVIVEGHADSDGTEAGNWSTSAQRATAVVRQMIKNDFIPAKLMAVGRSSFDPVSFLEGKAGHKLNRRVDIVIKPLTRIGS